MPDFMIEKYERNQTQPANPGDAVLWFLLGLKVVLVVSTLLALTLHVVQRVAVETAVIEQIGRY
ncbi:hypothetical protein FIU89_11265 [Roseovarius sp. THAF27]|uniref:hypothetical protein n=1 Tax=Roseovarius sp. THAF27 TaxID=2587850 RepID=UPI0012692731|nr:hypothetical protein [Roseovarius sp. THAF27]QFT81189.1 hypothetical protein FIU89_11265 [Roseovarius sp. THAF27]